MVFFLILIINLLRNHSNQPKICYKNKFHFRYIGEKFLNRPKKLPTHPKSLQICYVNKMELIAAAKTVKLENKRFSHEFEHDFDKVR